MLGFMNTKVEIQNLFIEQNLYSPNISFKESLRRFDEPIYPVLYTWQ